MSEGVKRPAKGIYVPPGRKRLEQNPQTEKKPTSNIISNAPTSHIDSNISNTSTNQISDKITHPLVKTQTELETTSTEVRDTSASENSSISSLASESDMIEEKKEGESIPSLAPELKEENVEPEKSKEETEKRNETNIPETKILETESLPSLAPEKKEENEKATISSLVSENNEEKNETKEGETENLETEESEKLSISSFTSESETIEEKNEIEKKEEIESIPSLAPELKEENHNATISSLVSETNSEVQDAENSKIKIDRESDFKNQTEIKSETNSDNSNNNNENEIKAESTNPSSPPTSPSRKKPDIQLFVPRRRMEAMEEDRIKKEKLKELEKQNEIKRLEEQRLIEEHQKRIEQAFFPERSGAKSPSKDNQRDNTTNKYVSPGRAKENEKLTRAPEKSKDSSVNWNDLIDDTPMGYYGANSKPVSTATSPKREERKTTLNPSTENNNNYKKMSWRNHDTDNNGGNYDSSPSECIESYAHLVEAHDLANGMQVVDIEDIFYGYPIKIKMVSKTNAILVFSSERDASDVLTNSVIAKSISIRPFSQSSFESREIWLKNTAMFAMPKNSRKSTTAIVASRMINNSLQLPRNTSPTQQPRVILKREAK